MSSRGFDDDRDLHSDFAELRRQDSSQAPDFAALLERQQARRAPFRLRALAAAACMVIVALLAARFWPRPRVAPLPSLTEWNSPTDFLLRTPARDLLYGVPHFGAWPEGAPAVAPPSPTEKKTI
ncbi:MAG TPA: hypothetical protein VFL42_04555 [Terriglobales bacterium]|nr:hypothetical protein [Terriglobales bacterium]